MGHPVNHGSPGLELEVEAYDGFEGAVVFPDGEVVLAEAETTTPYRYGQPIGKVRFQSGRVECK
jgi:hypothetical protein